MLLKALRAIKCEGGLGEGAQRKGWVLSCVQAGSRAGACQPLRALGMLGGVSGMEQATMQHGGASWHL